MTSPATRVVVPSPQQVPSNIYVNIPENPNGEDIVKTDIFDFSSITKVEAPRKRSVEYLILDDQGPPGKARGSGIVFDRDGNMQFRDQPNEDTNVVQVTTEKGSTVKYRVTFAIDISFVIKLRYRRQLGIQAIRVTVPNPVRTPGEALPPPLARQNFIFYQFLHPAAVQALNQAVQEQQNVPVFVEQFFTFEADKSVLDGANPENLRVVFEFIGTRRGRRTDLDSMTFSTPLPYLKDRRVYYNVKNPVKISAAATAIDQTVVTVRKPIDSRARGVNIYKRTIGPPNNRKSPKPFTLVREIDFLDDLGIGINDDYEFTFLDEATDNLLSHIYRAIPIGYDGAPAMTFDEIQTIPISQASYLEGEGRSITPIFINTGDRGNTTTLSGKYFLVDPNFLPSQALVDPFPESVSIVSSVTNQGIEIFASNFPERTSVHPFAASLVRRNLTKSERKFSLVKDRESANRPFAQADSLTFVDRDVLDQNIYEYALEMTYTNGTKQRTNDSTAIRYEDFRLMTSIDADLSAQFGNITTDSVEINTQITFNQNLIDLVTLLVGDRQQADVFIQDVQENRQSLASIASLVIIRKNTTTGEERVFSEEGLTRQEFVSFKTAEREQNVGENQNVSNTAVNKIFTDRSTVGGQDYRYEVTLNIRPPLDMTTRRTSVRPETGMPYVFQRCKMRSPLLMRRGILPPTPQGSDFINDQRFLDNGKDRLLNRLTPQSELELGSTNLRIRVPRRGSITMPAISSSPDLRVRQRYTRPGTTNLNFEINQGRANVSHYRIQVTDTYRLSQQFEWSQGNTQYDRVYDAGIVPGGQDLSRFEAEFSMPDLRQVDPLEFARQNLPLERQQPPPPMSDLQRAVRNGSVSITRRVSVIPVLLSGKSDTPQQALPESLTVKRSGQQAVQYSEVVAQ